MQRLLAFFFAAALLWTPAWSQSAPDALVPDLSQYILTPPAPPTPRINGAKVFGARPGSEFLFAIPASGDRPMTFAAEGLPKGLSLDPSTGFITGRVKKPGTYLVKLTARNALGEATRELRIVIGERIALTPPMGWNSWNCWARDVTQEQVLSSARAMVESGLVNHGWTYINIDDGWQGRRGGRYNAIQTNDKFPDMKELSEQVHAMGLKLGIYSSPWIGTYAAHIGSYSDNPDGENQWIKDGNHNENFRYEKPGGNYWQDRKEMYRHGAYSFVEADARQWADWQIDYLKYDWNPNDLYHVKEMHDALRATDRDIVYSISNSAPYADAPLWVEYTDCWRTTGDIRDTWKSISSIGFEQQRWAPFCGPGHWPDADMLVVGLVGWGPKLHYTKLTADEQYTHMSLWAMLASPLLIGCDLARLDPFTKSLLTRRGDRRQPGSAGRARRGDLGKGGTGDLRQAPRRRCDGRRVVQQNPRTREDRFHAQTTRHQGYAGRARPVETERPHDHRQGLRDTSPAPRGGAGQDRTRKSDTKRPEKIERSFLQTKKDTTHVVSFFVCGPPNGKRSAYLRFVPFFPERLCASCWRISSS